MSLQVKGLALLTHAPRLSEHQLWPEKQLPAGTQSPEE